MRLLSRLVSSLVIFLVGLGSTLHAAEPYPTRPIQVIVPAPPGGSLDIAARIIQPRLSAQLGVPVPIVNRPGASGTVGMTVVQSAPPDGYTIAATSTSTLTVVQLTSSSLPYKLDDFIPLGNYAVDAGVVVVHSDSPWKSLDDLIAYARQHPGKLNYGSYGGSLSSLNMEALKIAYGVNIVSIPYPGAPQANLAVLSKQVDIGASPFSAVRNNLQAGALRALLTSSDGRLQPLPDVPTVQEKNVRQAGLKLVIGLYAKAGTNPEVVDRLADGLRKAVENAEVSEALEKTGMFVRYVDKETARKELFSEAQDVEDLGRKLNLKK